jgi:hypothetical protein
MRLLEESADSPFLQEEFPQTIDLQPLEASTVSQDEDEEETNEQLLTQAAPLLLQVLEPPYTTTMPVAGNSESEQQLTNDLHSNTACPPSIPPPQRLEESALTQDMRHAASEEGNDANMGDSFTDESKRCLLDFVEWWCHRVIRARDTHEMRAAEMELQKALSNLQEPIKPTFGRLSNRLQIVAMCLDAGMMRIGKNPQNRAATSSSDESDTASPPGTIKEQYSADLLPEYWKILREELILLRSLLLRQDANVDSLVDCDVPPQANGTPEPQREQDPLFQKEYRHVSRLLKVQYTLCVFYQQLLEVRTKAAIEDADGSSPSTASSSQSNGSIELRKQLRQAVDDYEAQINRLFPQSEAAAEELLADADDNASILSILSVGSDVRCLPKELVGFLLKDLYAAKKSSNGNASTSVPPQKRLLDHVEAILFNKNSEYSHAKTIQALRRLLCQWHDHVLEKPTLVQLGYGLDPSTASPSRKRAEAEEDDMLRRLSAGADAQPLEVDDDDDDVSEFGASDDSEVDEGARQRRRRRRRVKRESNHNDGNNDEGATNQKVIKTVPIKTRWFSSCSEESSSNEADDEQDDDLFESKPKKRRIIKSQEESPTSTTYQSAILAAQAAVDADEASASSRRALLYAQSRRSRHSHPSSPASSSGNQQRRRRPFTDEEVQAIVDGVKKYGVGKWAIIRSNSGGALLSRDTVQIKDKYRNMVSAGMI